MKAGWILSTQTLLRVAEGAQDTDGRLQLCGTDVCAPNRESCM